jgi:hypothetical protein
MKVFVVRFPFYVTYEHSCSSSHIYLLSLAIQNRVLCAVSQQNVLGPEKQSHLAQWKEQRPSSGTGRGAVLFTLYRPTKWVNLRPKLRTQTSSHFIERSRGVPCQETGVCVKNRNNSEDHRGVHCRETRVCTAKKQGFGSRITPIAQRIAGVCTAEKQEFESRIIRIAQRTAGVCTEKEQGCALRRNRIWGQE